MKAAYLRCGVVLSRKEPLKLIGLNHNFGLSVPTAADDVDNHGSISLEINLSRVEEGIFISE